MPTINLIYEQRVLKRQREQRSRMMVMTTLGLAGMMALVSGYLMFESARFTIQSAQLEARREKLKDAMAAVERNKEAIAELQPRLTTLEAAQKDTERWSRLMAHLTTNTPTGVALTNLKCSQSDPTKGIQVLFNGRSVSQDAVGAMILRIDASEDVENVQLRFTQERVVEGGTAIEFEVNGQLTGTEPPKKATEAKEKA